MRSRSFTASPNLQTAPLSGLSPRYAAFGVLLVMTSCATSQPRTSQLAIPLYQEPVRSFQIQIHSTQDKNAADAMVLMAEEWWNILEERRQRHLFGVGYLPVEIKWLAPYYRVRIGHFRSREEARIVLTELAREFPAAFIVPDTIL